MGWGYGSGRQTPAHLGTRIQVALGGRRQEARKHTPQLRVGVSAVKRRKVAEIQAESSVGGQGGLLWGGDPHAKAGMMRSSRCLAEQGQALQTEGEAMPGPWEGRSRRRFRNGRVS